MKSETQRNDSTASNPAPAHPQLPSTGFIRLPQILQAIPVGRSTWWAWVKTGKAPKPVKLSDRVTAWRAQDIHDFCLKFNEGAGEHE